jgi:ribosomal protein S4
LKKFYKLLIKNTQFIRRFYGDMRQNELKKWANFFRSKQKLKKKWGLTNLILKLDYRLNSYLVRNGLVNTVGQLKQYILHGKVLVNNKVVRGYNFNINWLDHVSLKFNSNLKFNLFRIWHRFFFFKYLRLRLKSRSLMKYYINFNLLDEVYYNIEKLWFLNRLTILPQYILQYKHYIKKKIRIIQRRRFTGKYWVPINWPRRRFRFLLRNKIISFYYFRNKNKIKIWRKKILRKKKILFPFFLFIRWFLLIQKYSFYQKKNV